MSNEMKWSTKQGTWISGAYALERRRIPLYLTGGRQEYRYEITHNDAWIGNAPYLSDAKHFAEAHSGQLAAGIVPTKSVSDRREIS